MPGRPCGPVLAQPRGQEDRRLLHGQEVRPILVLVWVSPSCQRRRRHAAALASGPSSRGLAGGTDAAGGGGWPDWWVSSAAAALGPDWLRADPSAAGASASTGNPTNARAGVDKPVPARGSSGRQRGGRAPRPPPPVLAAPRAVDVDLTDPSSADWFDENTNAVVDKGVPARGGSGHQRGGPRT